MVRRNNTSSSWIHETYCEPCSALEEAQACTDIAKITRKRRLANPNHPLSYEINILHWKQSSWDALIVVYVFAVVITLQFCQQKSTVHFQRFCQMYSTFLHQFYHLSDGGFDVPIWDRVVKDLVLEEKERYKADIFATNILLQGLPKDIYTLINHYTDAKGIWDNVKMLLEGSELTRDECESQLYDDFEHFRQNKGKTIHEYYVRFTKLINDMRNIKMTMPKMQLNSKFVNNMLPEWGRFVTAVKLNRGLKTSNYDQLYAYLKQQEANANENKMILEKYTQHAIDPLAFVSNVSLQQYHAQSSVILQYAYVPPVTYQPQFANNTQPDSGLTPTDDLIENLTKTGRQKRVQGNNARGAVAAENRGVQNRVGNATPAQAKPIKCYNCNGIGHIARQCTHPKRPQNSEFFKDKMLLMQAQENC
ncbi:retrovirus-related pol polyprotein from transposon TNT 1-94 [Tanacetum coccineum]